jgi:hypothetical protein
MLRARLSIVALVALLAPFAGAGEVKVHQWPTQFVPLEVASFPVVMDVGFWMQITNQGDVIKLHQVTVTRYEGCIDLKVRTNFPLILSCSIAPTGVVPGTYTASIQNASMSPPSGTTPLCVTLTNANLTGVPGGTTNVHVATVTVRVQPQ